jgi:hypothetical protein
MVTAYKNIKLICAGLALVALSGAIQTQTADAVISPELREKMRKEARAQAPECLEIKVLSVKTKENQIFGYYPGKKSNGSKTEVMIEAKVLGIRRSKSGLKKGDVITINYTNPSLRDFYESTRSRGGALQYIEVLENERTYLVYVKAYVIRETGKRMYAPAAGDASFDVLE